jgi:hypothetical protein
MRHAIETAEKLETCWVTPLGRPQKKNPPAGQVGRLTDGTISFMVQ